MSKKKKNKHPTKPQSPKEQNLHKVARVTKQAFSGPLPHPLTLEQYDKIVPGAAERIIHMAEADAIHLREMEKLAITLAANEAKRGQQYGFAIAAIAFLSALVALLLGSEGTAKVIGGTTVVGLVTAFIAGRFVRLRQMAPTTPSAVHPDQAGPGYSRSGGH